MGSVAAILLSVGLFISSIPAVLVKPNCITVTVRSFVDHGKSVVVEARVDIYLGYPIMPPSVASGYTGSGGKVSFCDEQWIKPDTIYTAIAHFGGQTSAPTQFTTDAKASANIEVLFT